MKRNLLRLGVVAVIAAMVAACHDSGTHYRHDKNYDPKYHNHDYHQPHHRLRGD